MGIRHIEVTRQVCVELIDHIPVNLRKKPCDVVLQRNEGTRRQGEACGHEKEMDTGGSDGDKGHINKSTK
jgi:hypothetical protein